MQKIVTLIFFVVAALNANAQFINTYHEYLVNPYAISPSNSGFNGNHEVFVGGLYHMVGVPGSPVSVSANYNGILKGNSGLTSQMLSASTWNEIKSLLPDPKSLPTQTCLNRAKLMIVGQKQTGKNTLTNMLIQFNH